MKITKLLLFPLYKSNLYFLLIVLLLGVHTSSFAKSSSQIVDPASRVFESVRANPLALHAFLLRMPKGADLHSHLSGAVYAETYLHNAVDDQLCVDLTKLSLLEPIASTGNAQKPVCQEGGKPVASVLDDQNLYDALVDSLSMRDFLASAGISGHDHFFASFAKFNAISSKHTGEWLVEVANRAALQNEQYLELMQTGNFDHTKKIAEETGWLNDFAAQRNALLAKGLRDDIGIYSRKLDQDEKLQKQLGHCGEPLALPACQVKIRYLYQIQRGFPKQRVFAQTLLGFEIASHDSRVVGINLVMPEDGRLAMQDYLLQMQMIGFLHSVYPKVHISLHAGELSHGLVSPEQLCCHVRLAVEVAHAERIGHGVDVMYEQKPYELLKELAAKHVLIETNLTSNAVILGIENQDHPFPIERQFGVPLALSTDDEGISRIDLTHEFERAVNSYHLNYADLKQMVRASLEHSFLPGVSLWAKVDSFEHPVSACAIDSVGEPFPSSACAQLLYSSEKAEQQWQLEKRFQEFEYSLLETTAEAPRRR